MVLPEGSRKKQAEMGQDRLFNPLRGRFPYRQVVNSLCLVLVEVPLCLHVRVIYDFLQGPQWV